MMAYILLLAIAVFIGLLYYKKRYKREKPQPETGKPPEGAPVNNPAISNGGGIEVTTGYVLQDGKKKEVTIQYMPQGLQVFDKNGICILDVTDSLTRILGSFVAGTLSGSHAIDVRDNDRIFVFFVPETEEGSVPISITREGNMIYWEYRTDFKAENPDRIYYGTY